MQKTARFIGVKTTSSLPNKTQDEILRAADELRRRIAERLGANLDCSSRYVREDRER